MVRILCESPNAFDSRARGNFNYTPNQVGDMTLDQIFMLLTDCKLLRKKDKGSRTQEKSTLGVLEMADNDGKVKVRTSDGALLKLKRTGKSMVQIIEEREQAKKEKEQAKKNRKKRRGRR